MRITYSTCGIIPYPCAYISFWQPKWIVSTRATQETTGRPHYHFHHAVVRPVDHLFTFTDPCSGCVVPTPAAVVPAFYESVTDPAWRTAQAPVMSPSVQSLWIGPIPPLPGAWGAQLSARGLREPPVAGGGVGAGCGAGVQHRPAARGPVARARAWYGRRSRWCPKRKAWGHTRACAGRFTPVPPGCFRAGFDLGTLIPSPASPTGTYEWVIWKRRTCVLPVPVNWCAEALNGLPKLNACF